MESIVKNKRVMVLVVLGMVFAVYYSTIYRKQLKGIDLLRQTITSYNEILEINEEIITRVELIDVHLKIINERVNDIRLVLPPEINQDEALIIIQNAAYKSGLKIDNIRFFEIEKLEFGGDGFTQISNGIEDLRIITNEKISKAMEFIGFRVNEDTPSEDDFIDGEGYSLKTNVSANGTSSELMSFLNIINDIQNKVVVEGLRVDNSNENQLSANFDLVFYGITDKNAAKKGSYLNLSWTPQKPGEKNNIFMSYDGADNYFIADYVDNNDSFNVNKYDFTMRVIPFTQSMGPPSVSMVLKSLDLSQEGIPVVYGDSSEQEKVELYIDKIDGQYMCKFKTTYEGFPGNGFFDMAVFNPSGNQLRMLIDSTTRVSNEDISGVSISITNNSDKTFIVDVINDDLIRPRVTINRMTENIRVNYN
ncbi:UNVERIFIED_CONTAM: hypothetical protein Cloal_4421 [Acetivibrio alkalicellulosi]